MTIKWDILRLLTYWIHINYSSKHNLLSNKVAKQELKYRWVGRRCFFLYTWYLISSGFAVYGSLMLFIQQVWFGHRTLSQVEERNIFNIMLYTKWCLWNNYGYAMLIQKRLLLLGRSGKALWRRRRKYWKRGMMRCWNEEVLFISGEENTVNKGTEKEKCVVTKFGSFIISGLGQSNRK